MSKYLRGDSHSLHREHGFSWGGVFLLQSLGFPLLGSISIKKAIWCAGLGLGLGAVGFGQIGIV